MPGYIIHLTEAHILLEQLAEDAVFSSRLSESGWSRDDWKNAFLCGALLPDAVSGDKSGSHFWDADSEGNIFRVPNLERFLTAHPLSIKDPILCGFYAHLHLDHRFFREFIPGSVEFIDADGNPTYNGGDGVRVRLKASGTITSMERFFSEEYLYGDYTKLNLKLIEQFTLSIPECERLEDRECCAVRVSELKVLLSDLEQFLAQSRQAAGSTVIFEQSELAAFLRKTAQETKRILLIGEET